MTKEEQAFDIIKPYLKDIKGGWVIKDDSKVSKCVERFEPSNAGFASCITSYDNEEYDTQATKEIIEDLENDWNEQDTIEDHFQLSSDDCEKLDALGDKIYYERNDKLMNMLIGYVKEVL